MPLGLFADRDPLGDDPLPPPSSHAVLTGTVRETSKLQNEETAAPYHWLLVQCADATFDIVADPQLMPADLTAGSMVQIGCLFFGRLVG
jgi:hypothetical protein